MERLEKRIAMMERSLRRSSQVQGQAQSPTHSMPGCREAPSLKHTAEGATCSGSSTKGTRHLAADQMIEQICETQMMTSNGSFDENMMILRDKLSALFPDENSVKGLKLQISRGPFVLNKFTDLAQKTHLKSLFEIAFDDFNCSWPLFNPSMLIALLDEQDISDAASTCESLTRWGMLNSAAAIAIQSRIAKGSYNEMIDLSWHFFKNSFSLFSVLVSRGTDILVLETLLAMALFTHGSTDLRTTSLLISTAARISLTLGFHRKTFYTDMDPVRAERHRRAFWIAYILDQDMSIKTGLPSVYSNDDLGLDYASSGSLGVPGKIAISGNRVEAIVFRIRTELAMIQSSIQSRLYSEKSAKMTVTQLLGAAVELDHQLEEWKEKIPSEMQPGHTLWSAVAPLKEPIISLHFAYYHAVGVIHSFVARLKPGDDITLLPQCVSSALTHTSTAYETIRLLQHLPPQLPGALWQVLCHPLSACIALLEILLRSPTDVRARSHLRHISNFVKFLTKAQHREDFDIGRMLDFCSEMERVAVDALAKATNMPQPAELTVGDSSATVFDAKVQRLTSQLASSTSYMQLAQGLMGNLPNLRSVASNVFSEFVAIERHLSSPGGLLAPVALIPETYQFAFTLNRD